MTDSPTSSQHPAHLMQCMEVWGGNQAMDAGVVMAGLDAWVYSKPYCPAKSDASSASGSAESPAADVSSALPASAEAVGGDVYYVSSCATGRITRLLVADVTGHGTQVGETALKLRSLMRRYVNYLDQTQFVEAMNAQFAAMSDSGCFATAVVTTFFAPNRLLTFSNAGHPPPLIYRAASRTWRYMKRCDDPSKGRRELAPRPSDLPLGIIDDSSYDQFDVRLKVGDLVLFYTDAFIEARSPDGRMLGSEGLLEVVRDVSASDPARFIASLLEAIERRAPNGLCEDDVTAMLFRPNGLAPRTSLKEKLMVPIRVFSAAARDIVRGRRPSLPDLRLANIGGALIGPLNNWWRGVRGVEEPGVDESKPA